MNLNNIDTNSEVAKELFKVLLNALNNGITDFHPANGIGKRNIFDNINPDLYLNPKHGENIKLKQIKEELLSLITKKNNSAFDKFKTILSIDSEKYFDIVHLEARLNRVTDGNMRGVVDWDTYSREMNQIVGSFIYFVKSLELTDVE